MLLGKPVIRSDLPGEKCFSTSNLVLLGKFGDQIISSKKEGPSLRIGVFIIPPKEVLVAFKVPPRASIKHRSDKR